MSRTEYSLALTINGKQISRVVIDQHYKEKHAELDDKIIIELVRELNGGNFPIEEEKEGFQYFVVEPVFYGKRPYRLVLLLYIYDDFIGVINAFRVKKAER